MFITALKQYKMRHVYEIIHQSLLIGFCINYIFSSKQMTIFELNDEIILYRI